MASTWCSHATAFAPEHGHRPVVDRGRPVLGVRVDGNADTHDPLVRDHHGNLHRTPARVNHRTENAACGERRLLVAASALVPKRGSAKPMASAVVIPIEERSFRDGEVVKLVPLIGPTERQLGDTTTRLGERSASALKRKYVECQRENSGSHTGSDAFGVQGITAKAHESPNVRTSQRKVLRVDRASVYGVRPGSSWSARTNS